MPETKHTPGPWLAEGTIQATDPERIVGPALYVFAASAVGGECIAYTSSEANARLIAAAPELLAALKVRTLIAELQRLYALATRPQALHGGSGRSVPARPVA